MCQNQSLGIETRLSVPRIVDFLFGYLRKSLDEFSMTATSGSDWAAAAAIGGNQPVAANVMPTTL